MIPPYLAGVECLAVLFLGVVPITEGDMSATRPPKLDIIYNLLTGSGLRCVLRFATCVLRVIC